MANEYISREAAIRFFNEWIDDLNKQIDDSVAYPHLRSDYKVCKTQLLDCIHALDEMPAADVVEVVRCKDCDTYHRGGCPDGYGVCMAPEVYGSVLPEDFFCKYGERRETNDG